MFQFKQFSVDQSGCAMKINTDGVLLGAMSFAIEPKNTLDIGTGTGVIALMLAQKFANAQIDAVEIDADAATTADRNFRNSAFAENLKVYPLSFEHYFELYPEKEYDLIVSNPPFYIDSLKSPGAKKAIAKHSDIKFFENLVKSVSVNLTGDGSFWTVLPPDVADFVIELAAINLLYPGKIINIQSFEHSERHRVILCFGFNKYLPEITNFTIYKSKDVYSDDYMKLLQPYFLAF